MIYCVVLLLLIGVKDIVNLSISTIIKGTSSGICGSNIISICFNIITGLLLAFSGLGKNMENQKYSAELKNIYNKT